MSVLKQTHTIELYIVWNLMNVIMYIQSSWFTHVYYTVTLKESNHSPRDELDSSNLFILLILLRGLGAEKTGFSDLKLNQKGKEQQGAYYYIHRVVGKGHLFHDLRMQQGCQGKLSKGNWIDDDCLLLYELFHFRIIVKHYRYCFYYSGDKGGHAILLGGRGVSDDNHNTFPNSFWGIGP